jgi:hypothetical protein
MLTSQKFDMATSAIALFGVLTAKAQGHSLPIGVAYNSKGGPTVDASEALDGGAIATFGGHKGAGLSLCVEILAGALSGGAVLGQVPSKKLAKVCDQDCHETPTILRLSRCMTSAVLLILFVCYSAMVHNSNLELGPHNHCYQSRCICR